MRILIVLATVAVLAVAFVLVRPDDDDEDSAGTTETTVRTATTAATTASKPTPKATQIVVRVRGGRSVDGIVRETANQGDPVVVTVRSDDSDHVHVHGYDLMADVAPGRPARIRFIAKLTGRFEIELEDRREQIALLTVVP